MTYRPPFIGSARIRDWITKDKQRIKGIQLRGAHGIAAHLTAQEARELADTLHDLSDKLEQPSLPTQPQKPPTDPPPAYITRTPLTAADGTEEPPLPTGTPE